MSIPPAGTQPQPAESRALERMVSVVVPVFAATDSLKLCLEALECQTWRRSMEVIVVDNGDENDPALEEMIAMFPRVRLVRESQPGSYAARNRGIELASGEILAFTDADCVPARDWIDKGVEALDALPGPGMVAGQIDIFFSDNHRPTAVELYESVAAFRQRDYIQHWRFGATANLFTHRILFDRLGSFDDRLKSIGDVEWGWRVHMAGYPQAFTPHARIAHPARRTLGELRARAARTTGGFRDMATRTNWPLRSLVTYATVGMVPLGDLLGRSGKLSGIGQRVRVASVVALLVGVRAVEMIRLSLGRPSKR